MKSYTSVAKDLKLKVRKFFGLLPTFAEITEENLVEENRPILNRVNKFSGDIFFIPKVKYLMVHSSNFNPCEYVPTILIGKRLKDYGGIFSFGEMIRRKLREMLYKGLSSEIYNTIFYTVHKKYVTNKYGHAKIESSHLNTEIWTMTCDWETLLKRRKKCKAFTYWTENP